VRRHPCLQREGPGPNPVSGRTSGSMARLSSKYRHPLANYLDAVLPQPDPPELCDWLDHQPSRLRASGVVLTDRLGDREIASVASTLRSRLPARWGTRVTTRTRDSLQSDLLIRRSELHPSSDERSRRRPGRRPDRSRAVAAR
jgi:hypothetical protein